jgi:hypothetical protein
MVAFVVGLLFVAATRAVAVINEALPQVMVLVIAGLGFLMMIGIFSKPGGTIFEKLDGKLMLAIEIIMGIAVIFIFLGTLRLNNGQSWLSYGWNYLINYWSGAVVGSIAMFIFVIIVIYFVVGGSENKGGDK